MIFDCGFVDGESVRGFEIDATPLPAKHRNWLDFITINCRLYLRMAECNRLRIQSNYIIFVHFQWFCGKFKRFSWQNGVGMNDMFVMDQTMVSARYFADVL